MTLNNPPMVMTVDLTSWVRRDLIFLQFVFPISLSSSRAIYAKKKV
ncbi:hypothetical protein LINPERPRIM_LOCUS15309 [Linum perenne]